MPRPASLDPELLITTLAEHDVKYVLIGALAARLYGFPRVTADADITAQRETNNLEHLAAALRELDARVFIEGTPAGLRFDCTARTLDAGGARRVHRRRGVRDRGGGIIRRDSVHPRYPVPFR